MFEYSISILCRFFDSAARLLFFFVCVVFLLSCIGVSSTTASVIAVDKAIQIIKLKEKTITSFSWKCKTNKYQSGADGKLTPLFVPPLPSYSNVYIDAKGRYRIEKTTMLPQLPNVADTECSELFSFDGSVFRLEKAFFAPKKHPRISGYIFQDNRKNLAAVNWNLYPEGIGFVFPYFAWTSGAVDAKTKKLSEYLEHIRSLKRDILVDENSGGIWRIVVPDYVDVQSGLTIYVHITFDPSKGKSGAILSVVKSRLSEIGTEDGVKTLYELQNVGDFYFPKSVRQEQLMGRGLPSCFIILEYSDIKVNEDFSDADFQITWKNGTAMVDYITGKSYLVTGSPVDEAQATHDFMSLEGLTKPQEIQKISVFYFRIILVVFGLSLIAYGLYSHYKKKKNDK